MTNHIMGAIKMQESLLILTNTATIAISFKLRGLTWFFANEMMLSQRSNEVCNCLRNCIESFGQKHTKKDILSDVLSYKHYCKSKFTPIIIFLSLLSDLKKNCSDSDTITYSNLKSASE